MRFSGRLVLAACALAPTLAFAHARLSYPTPRSQNAGIKSPAPCGSDPRTAPTVFRPGETITVRWEETITHPGYYRIAFSPVDNQGFDANVLANDIPNPSGLQDGQFDITLPNIECEGCSLQLIQVMTDSNSNYYSCADIALRSPTGDAGVPDAGEQDDAGTSDQDAGTDGDAGVGLDGGTPGDDFPEARHATQAVGGCSAVAVPGGWSLVAALTLLHLSRRRVSPRD